jgi:hypothetical protein
MNVCIVKKMKIYKKEWRKAIKPLNMLLCELRMLFWGVGHFVDSLSINTVAQILKNYFEELREEVELRVHFNCALHIFGE